MGLDAIPAKYKWLKEEDGPLMLVHALRLYGTKEIVGPKHNATILSWADAVGVGSLVNDDEQAWCGLFVAYVAYLANKPLPMKGWNILRALQWVNFGKLADTPMLGDVLIFSRLGGGHVGIYVGEDKECFHVLGGNQGNAVTITRIPKNRILTARRPIYNIQPKNVRKVYLDASGDISTNEA